MVSVRASLVLFAVLAAFSALAQGDSTAVTSGSIVTDTLDWRHDHSPKKATILSAIVPGAGQVYNRKYWKVPIVLGGLGVSYYFIRENNSEYQRYKDAYLAMIDGDPNTVDEFNGAYSAQSILNTADTYRRWRDMSYIAIGLVYILNVVDANVDAKFVRFDVSSDLSMAVSPSLYTASQGAPGLTFALTLR